MTFGRVLLVAVVAAVVVGSTVPAAGGPAVREAPSSELAPAAGTTLPGPVPSEVDVGSAYVGESTERTFTFENPSTQSFRVGGLSITGEDADAFEIVSGGGSVTVGAGETHSVTVRFTPTHVGDHDARVSASSNAPGSPHSAVLDGEGLARPDPEAAISPGAHDFGTIQVGQSGSTSVVVRNTGDDPLDLESATLSGAEDYSIDAGLPAELGVGERVALEVTFTPDETGQSEATLEVATNDTDNPTVSTSFVGEGIETDLSVEPASVSFGEQPVGETVERSIVVTNDGTEPVSVTNLDVVGEDADVFGIEGEPGTIEPEESVSVTVTFQPEAAVGYAAKLSVETSSEEVGQLGVALSGSGSAPDVHVAPPHVNFGKTVSDDIVTREVRVTNKGSEPLELEGYDVVGANPGAFQVVDGPDTFSLDPGTGETLTVQFAPGEPGTYAATLVVESNDPDEPATTIYLSNTRTTIKQDTRSDVRDGTRESEIEVNDAENDSTLTFTFTGASERSQALSSGAAVQASSADSNVSLDVLNMTIRRGGDFRLGVTTSPSELGTTPEFELQPRNGTQPVGYLNVSHTISDENIREVEFNHRVSKRMLDEQDATIEDYALYRHVDGEWVELDYEVVGETETHYVVEATSPGLSDFTSGVKQPKFRVVNANVTVTKLTRGDDVGVRVEIRNDGGSDGTYTTQLILNGDVVNQKDVTIAAENRRVVTFEREISEPGTYTVKVNDLEVDQIEVDPGEIDQGTATATENDPGDGSTGAGAPGFGVVIALVALLAGVQLHRRRR